MKRNLHAKYGVREYRIVDPEGKRVELLSWTEGGYRTEALYPHTDRLETGFPGSEQFRVCK